MVAPLALAATASQFGRKGLKQTRELSVSITGYDFVGLASRLIVFFLVAYGINLYFKATIAGGTFLNAVGLNFPATTPEWLRKLFEEGYQGVTYWNIIQTIAILLVVMEALQYDRKLKESGEKPNATTLGLFALIVLGLALVTFPQMIQKIQEFQLMVKRTTVGEFAGQFNPPDWNRAYDYGSEQHRRDDPSSFPRGY